MIKRYSYATIAEKIENTNEFARRVGIISRGIFFNHFDYLKAYEIDTKFEKKKNFFVISNSVEIGVIESIQVI